MVPYDNACIVWIRFTKKKKKTFLVTSASRKGEPNRKVVRSTYEIEPAVWGRVGHDPRLQPPTQPEGCIHDSIFSWPANLP